MSERSPKAPVPRLALTPTEAASALGVSFDYYVEHVAHELRAVRRGRMRLVPVTEVQRWLERQASLPLEGEASG